MWGKRSDTDFRSRRRRLEPVAVLLSIVTVLSVVAPFGIVGVGFVGSATAAGPTSVPVGGEITDSGYYLPEGGYGGPLRTNADDSAGEYDLRGADLSQRALAVEETLSWPEAGADPGDTGHLPNGTGPNGNVTESWNRSFSSNAVYSSPVVDGTAFVAATDDLHALNATTGATEWSAPSAVPLVSTIPPVYADGVVYGFSHSNVVVALDASDGSELWTYSSFDEIPAYAHIKGATVENDTLYVTIDEGDAGDDYVYAIDTTSRTERWAVAFGSSGIAAGPVVTDGYVVVRDRSTRTWILNASDGSETQLTPTGSSFSDPIANDGVLLTPRYRVENSVIQGYALAYDLDAVVSGGNGLLWNGSLTSATGFPKATALADDTLYVGTHSGDLAALNASTGAVEWTYAQSPSDGEAFDDVVVADGVVYYTTDDATTLAAVQNGSFLWNYTLSDGLNWPALADCTLFGTIDSNYDVFAALTGDACGATGASGGGQGGSGGSGGASAPEITVSPATLNFGNVTVGNSASLAVDIRNDGSATLSVAGTTLAGSVPGDYAVTNGGAFTLAPGANRTLSVTYSPSSNATHGATLNVTANDSDEPETAVTLSGTGLKASPGGSSATIEGTVVDGSSSPLSGVRVTGYGPNGPVSTSTDAAGNFSMTVDPGFWGLDLSKPGYGTTSEFVEVNASETKHRSVTMRASGTISGTVTDGAGTPIQGATIDVWGPDSGSDSTDANGRYSVDVGSGRYTVTVRASGYPTERVRGVRVSAGGTKTVDVTLERPGYVTGTVLEEDGSAAANAYVMADDGESAVFGTTNASGGFNLSVTPGSYTVSAFAKSGKGMSTAANTVSVAGGGSADAGTLQFVTPAILATNVTHVGGTRPDVSNVSVDAQVSGGMMLVRLVNDSAPASGMPSDLTGLGADRTTEFEITLTVDDYDPSALLWGARDVTWTATPNGTTPGATDLTIRTKTVHLAGINDGSLPVGPLRFKSPGGIQWPQGANDTADLGWENTVYLVVYDLSNVPPGVSRDLEGMTVVTNAQTFSRPQMVGNTLRVYAAGPHFTKDGAVHDGFYSAFVPNTQLDEWGVTDPATDLNAKWAGDPESFTVEETSGGAWIHLDIHYSDGYAEIEPSTGASSGGSSGSSGSSGSVGRRSEADDESTTTTVTSTPAPSPTRSSVATSTTRSTADGPAAPAEPTTTTDDPGRPLQTTTDTPGQSGFGPIVAAVALLVAAGLARRRRP